MDESKITIGDKERSDNAKEIFSDFIGLNYKPQSWIITFNLNTTTLCSAYSSEGTEPDLVMVVGIWDGFAHTSILNTNSKSF